MPIFEYRCDDCGTKFEKLIRRPTDTDPDNLVCPSCGKSHLTQQLSTFAAHANSKPQASAPPCASGMCPTPGLCGRN